MPADRDALLDPDRIRSIGFSTAFRGYDQHEVRRFLEQLAEAVRAIRTGAPRATDTRTDGTPPAETTPAAPATAELERTVAELRSTVTDLRQELAARDAAAAEAVPFDEERAAELLGRETARVLEAARVAAGERARQAAADADRVRADADAHRAAAMSDAERMRAEAEAYRAAVEAEADRIRADADDLRAAATAEAERIRTEAAESARRSVADAEDTAGRLVAEAEATARRVGAEAEERARQVVAEAEGSASRSVAAAEERARLLVAEAEASAERVVAGAEEAAGRLVAEAEAERQRIRDEADAARRSASAALEQLASERRAALGGLRAVHARLDGVLAGLDPDDEEEPGPPARTPHALTDVGIAQPTAGHGDDAAPEPVAAGAVPGSTPVGDAGAMAGEPVVLAPFDTAELDDLFARVRAGRDRAVSEARRVLAGADEDEASPGGPLAGPSGEATAPSGRGAPAPAGRSDRDGAIARPMAGGPHAPARTADPVAGWDDALAQLQQDALRRLKRALVEAQSELLEVVSRERDPMTIDALPDPAAEVPRYLPAVEPAIRAAVAAGAAGSAGSAGAPETVDEGRVAEGATGLASDVAAAVHAGGVEAITATGGEPERLLDEIRAQHRRFRTVELGRLVAAALGSAHARSRAAGTAEDGGTVAAAASAPGDDSDAGPSRGADAAGGSVDPRPDR